jgi:hypothetical protein
MDVFECAPYAMRPWRLRSPALNASSPKSTPPLAPDLRKVEIGRLSDIERARNEAVVRAAMDRLLRGEIPPGGECDVKSLAAEAGVIRTGVYTQGGAQDVTDRG